jgi:hypothetical protein
MRFIFSALLGLILLPWHQALALPAIPTKIAKIERDSITPYIATANHTVVRTGISLGTSGGEDWWTSTAIQERLIFDMPGTIANTMGILSTLVAWKLVYTYSGASNGGGNVDINILPDGQQQPGEIQICTWDSTTVTNTGTSGGNSWVQIQVPLEVVWLDTITNQLISVFWAATYQFGQNDPDLSFEVSMDAAPKGFQQPGPLPASGCPGWYVGTLVIPKSWTLLPWSSIVSV